MVVKCCVATQSETAKKRNGQTNPTLRKLNAPRENGLVLPQSGDGRRRGAPAVGSERSASSCQPSAISRRWFTGASVLAVVIVARLRLRSDAPQQVFKARVGPQFVEGRRGAQQDEVTVALLDRPIHPLEGFVHVAEPGVDQREGRRRQSRPYTVERPCRPWFASFRRDGSNQLLSAVAGIDAE